MHSGSVFSAPVASGLHCHGQILCDTKGADEKRHQDRHQAFGTLQQAARFEVGSPRLLRFHDLIGFLQQGRYESQGDGHHHGDFMGRYANSPQRRQQTLDAVCQAEGPGAESQH